MKKFYTLLAAIGAVASLQAQQLPNAGFEDDWADCYPWSSANNTAGPFEGTNAQGTTPKPWCISNVYAGSGALAMGNKTLGTQLTLDDASSAVYLKDAQVSLGTLVQKLIPSYITLGTSWSTSKGMAATNKDGGAFGGIEFTNRPDAIVFSYRNKTATTNSTVVAYLWKGTYTMTDVPANISMGTPSTVTMVDRDRQVLGMDLSDCQGTATEPSADAACIAKISTTLDNADNLEGDWLQKTLEFEYLADATPEKINVIFSAGDYFNSNRAFEDVCSLQIDNVKLLYYSRLASLSVNGTPVENFATDKYDYELALDMPESADEIEAETLGQSKTATTDITLDPAKKLAVITVANAQGEDADEETQHVYTLHFNGASAISDLSSDAARTSAQYYNLQGLSVNADALVPGQTYIKVYGGTATKFVAL